MNKVDYYRVSTIIIDYSLSNVQTTPKNKALKQSAE